MQTSNNPLKELKSNQRVFIHGGAATPSTLIKLLVEEAPRLRNVELIHLHTMGEARYARPEFSESFKVANLFVGANMRKNLNSDNVDYLPCFLSEIPSLFRNRVRPLDVALIHVSTPNDQGFCSLGVSVDVARAAVDSAQLVIAQINRRMPFIAGDGVIHINQIHHAIDTDEDLPTSPHVLPSAEDLVIGQHASSLIENGSTLQVGIGSVPDAILSTLSSHRNLGIHSEMWSDGVLDLIRCGAVDNSEKKIHPGKSVSAFVIGTKNLYDFMNNNPEVLQLDAAYVNDPNVIAKNPKVIAINSAVEIDLTGQVCADSIGHRIISGVGGQMDFIRGASLSSGGKPIIALRSRTRHGKSRIVPALQAGAGVVTTRAHAHYVITEFGITNLFGKTLRERARELINLSHPDDRENLSRSWHDLHRSRI